MGFNKLKKLNVCLASALLSLSMSGMAMAQEAQVATQPEQSTEINHANCEKKITRKALKTLSYAIALDELDGAKKIADKYCVNFSSNIFEALKINNPIFYASAKDTVAFLVEKDKRLLNRLENNYGIDALTSLLLLPYLENYALSKEDGELLIPLLEEEGVKVTLDEIFDKANFAIQKTDKTFKDPQIEGNRQELIRLVLEKYKNADKVETNPLGNSVVDYAVLLNNAEVFKGVLENKTNYDFYKKNKDGLTAFHFAFANLPAFGFTPEQVAQNKAEINKVLLENFDAKRIKDLRFGSSGGPFLGFVAHYAKNNNELAQGILQKIKEAKIKKFSKAELVLDGGAAAFFDKMVVGYVVSPYIPKGVVINRGVPASAMPANVNATQNAGFPQATRTPATILAPATNSQ